MIPDCIVIHTSASTARNVSARTIDRWHRRNGWSRIGYHYVILDGNRVDWQRDGELERGRSLTEPGAHAYGVNRHSIGICLVGDGDRVPWTMAQRNSLLYVVERTCHQFSIPIRRVVGHREIERLGARHPNKEPVTTTKSCPGLANDVDWLRQALAHRRLLS